MKPIMRNFIEMPLWNLIHNIVWLWYWDLYIQVKHDLLKSHIALYLLWSIIIENKSTNLQSKSEYSYSVYIGN